MSLAFAAAGLCAELVPAPGTKLPPFPGDRVITAADVTVERVGTSIPVSAIGEPVAGVTLSPPRWVQATENSVAHALVEGAIAPKDPKGKPINFRVLLPATWSRRAIQVGGGGMNGMVHMLRGERPGSLTASFARYGSDSGHQMGGGFGGPGFGTRGGGAGDDWALNEEAIRNLGCMQMKKTHDAAMVIMERVYGERPRFNYYIGASQGGREALTVAQRYPADYDGIVADVPIVNFSSLMLAPVLIRIQEKPLSNWVTRAKANAIRAEFMRQADQLDGLADGVINNYMAARALFDLSQGDPKRNPWAALRAPDGVDLDPTDTSAKARLTDGQIATLKHRFQSLLDTMGRKQVDAFARFYVIPQAGHGLSGRSHGTNGDGQSVPSFQIPNRFDRTALIAAWVERNEAPAKTLVVTAGGRSLLLCSYPDYPRYRGGPPESAESYVSTAP